MISPLGKCSTKLDNYFSEKALMQMRCAIEILYLQALGVINENSNPILKKQIKDIYDNFSEEDFLRIKEIEKEVKHEVKACVIFLKERLFLDKKNFIHIGLTSEDINNLTYNVLLKQYVEEEQLPQLKILIEFLLNIVKLWKEYPFPTRTHGQLASPSTAGKEFAVFLSRLIRQYKKLKDFKFTGKLSGATGNLSALKEAFPRANWMKFSVQFIKALDLTPNLVTTQVDDHDTWAEYFNLIRQINNILLDLNLDCWMYISHDYLAGIPEDKEIESSTMPHKINPVNFENSEGNLYLSNSLLETLSNQLCRSRMQRDLSGSILTKNIGVALAHSHLAIQETLEGLKSLALNRFTCERVLKTHPELLCEPIQTILKVSSQIENPYEKLKEFTKGQKRTKEDLNIFIENLDISDSLKYQLQGLDILKYTGYAVEICDLVINGVERVLKEEKNG